LSFFAWLDFSALRRPIGGFQIYIVKMEGCWSDRLWDQISCVQGGKSELELMLGQGG